MIGAYTTDAKDIHTWVSANSCGDDCIPTPPLLVKRAIEYPAATHTMPGEYGVPFPRDNSGHCGGGGRGVNGDVRTDTVDAAVGTIPNNHVSDRVHTPKVDLKPRVRSGRRVAATDAGREIHRPAIDAVAWWPRAE